jgi:hypothetical protein
LLPFVENGSGSKALGSFQRRGGKLKKRGPRLEEKEKLKISKSLSRKSFPPSAPVVFEGCQPRWLLSV